MKVNELYHSVLQILNDANCDSPSFDALCLLEDIAKLGRGNVPFHINDELDDSLCKQVLSAAKKRANGVPLQYILGSWDFLSLTLRVGEGVLIPRPETELLCQSVAEKLFKKKQGAHVTIWDLCAGSGCVGLGIASLYPNCDVFSYEFSQEAAVYLQKNIADHPKLSVTPIFADVLNDYSLYNEAVDVIVSNPPYIPTEELPTLQKEVQYEPRMALDGGDGYRFYRVIAEKWIPKLTVGGIAAVEVGVHQAKTVAQLFETAGLSNITIIQDFSNIDRVVMGEKR